jgi:serine/threonine protein kinase
VDARCPSENDFLARANGALTSEQARHFDAHVDVCADCRVMLAGAADALAEPGDERESAATFAAGEIIAERYVMVRWLASGGMGEVYEVHDTWMDEKVALKTIAAAIADDPRALSRLKAEVRTARRVTHENVCRVYDLGFYKRDREQIAFLTMELLPGVTLRQKLDIAGPFEGDVARRLIARMAEALRHAHAAGIVHRDFKSDNVMLMTASNGEISRVVVMDFGLARQSLVGTSQPLTPNSRTVFGTLDYMSPEQVMGRVATPASDVYSLGVVIFELLTGRLPFDGDTPLARALKRVTEKAPPLARSLPAVSKELEVCVATCLQQKPEARFASIDELLRVLDGQAVPRARFERWRAAMIAGLVFTLALALFLFMHRRPASAEMQTLRAGPGAVPGERAALASLRSDEMHAPQPSSAAIPSASSSVALVAATTPKVASARSVASPGHPLRPTPSIPGANPYALVRAETAAPALPRSERATSVDEATPVSKQPNTGTGDALLNPFGGGAPSALRIRH